MIKTKTAVTYDLIAPWEQEIVHAKITKTIRNDENETYTLVFQEWVEIPYQAEIPDENGNLVLTDLVKKKILPESVRPPRVMTFEEAETLTANLDLMFTITETGVYRRKKYVELGHLLINNMENVRGVEWELV